MHCKRKGIVRSTCSLCGHVCGCMHYLFGTGCCPSFLVQDLTAATVQVLQLQTQLVGDGHDQLSGSAS